MGVWRQCARAMTGSLHAATSTVTSPAAAAAWSSRYLLIIRRQKERSRSMDEAVWRLRPERIREAAGYVRVSSERQAGGYSPEVQREAIRRMAAQEGYALTLVEEDHERGSKITRVGYQKIIESVRAGTIHAVIVFMFDRWGRDSAEWLTRVREFERLGVPIISV